MDQFLNVTWSGIWIGCEYAVIGVALVLNFRAGRVVNLAVGEVFVFAFLLAAWLQEGGLSPLLAMLAAVVVGAALTGGQDYLLLQRLRRSTSATLLLATLGVSTLLSGIAVVVFGRDPTSGEGIVRDGTVAFGPVRTNWPTIVFVAAVVALIMFAWWSTSKTETGRAMAAAGHDAGAAAMLGINVPRLRLMATAGSGAMLGITGALFLPLGVLDFSLGLRLTLFGFVAAALAGYESVPGALIGGWTFGIVDALGTTYVSSTFGLFFTFSALIVIALATQRIRTDREVFDSV